MWMFTKTVRGKVVVLEVRSGWTEAEAIERCEVIAKEFEVAVDLWKRKHDVIPEIF